MYQRCLALDQYSLVHLTQLASAMKEITLHDVFLANKRLGDYLYQTPTITHESLNDLLGCTVYWKLESLQKTNAFKVRGALNKVLCLSRDETGRGIIAASSGNHGIGTSFSAKILGVENIIVMPWNTPRIKQDKIKLLGGQVILVGDNYDDALGFASEFAASKGMFLIPSFDDPLIIAGQGTIGLEIIDQINNFDVLMTPIGGGGLAAGLGIVTRSLKPKVLIYGVQAKAAPSCQASFLRGKRTIVKPMPTLADGIAVAEPGLYTFPVIQKTIDDILLVEENVIAEALSLLVKYLRIIVEPAAAVTLAAILTHPGIFLEKKIVCVLSGANIDHRRLIETLNYQADLEHNT